MQGDWIQKPKGETSVVFVHGILSSGETCWRNENNSYWPELLKNEPELDALGIYVYTYQTGVFSGNYRLGDVVDDLKERLRLDDVFDCKRLIFVCHSMGGIVVRKFLVERVVDLIEWKIEVGLFLVASPSLGSSYANWLSTIARSLGHKQANALRFTQDNDWLNDLAEEFRNLKEAGRLKIKGKELVEDKFVVLKRLWGKQLVEPFSGATFFGEPIKISLSDHFSIAKPDSKGALQHRLLREFIEKMLMPFNLTGDWEVFQGDGQYSYDVKLKQTGNKVSGKYELPGGWGTIEGLVDGDLLEFLWDQPFNNRSGKGKLNIWPSGKKMSGDWSYDRTKYDEPGATWTFEKK